MVRSQRCMSRIGGRFRVTNVTWVNREAEKESAGVGGGHRVTCCSQSAGKN